MLIGKTVENEEFITALFQKEWSKLVRYAKIQMRRYGASPVDLDGRAEEMVQEVFCSACDKIEEIKKVPRPEAWLYVALYYEIQTGLRDDKKWEKCLRLLPSTDQAEPKEDIHFLEQLMAKEDLELLVRIYKEGYKYEELARMIGITKSALAMRLHRIKKKAKEKYEKNM